MAPGSIAIGLLGDVMLGRMVADALGRQTPHSLWSAKFRELASQLDLVVCNLECCVSSRGAPTAVIEGKPFFFRGPPVALDALKAINIGAVSLANNHALDFGPDALADTLELLGSADIAAAGAGLGPDAARRPAVLSAGGLTVGLVAVTDHPAQYAVRPGELGVAYGALQEAPPSWLLEAIGAARRQCDLVIAFPHWGPNMTTRPSADQQRVGALLLEAGADLVAGHSAHVFHGVGWAARPIVFDLGDALDDYRVDPGLRNDLGLLAIWRPDGGGPELELVGLGLDFCHTRLADGGEAQWIADRLSRACGELGTSVTRVGEQRFVIEPGHASSNA
jgi:poly-gamma-glutamate capsule biosynthesis protein CapA/YwtB (metallophosphatase superfamily)